MKKYAVGAKGITPLLMNRFIEAGQLDATKKKLITGKKTAVEDKLYTTEDGKPYLPARYFEACFIEAGKSFKGKGKSTLSKILGSMLSVAPDGIVLKAKKWVVDKQVGVNPMTGGRMIIERPRFDEWSCEFELIIDTDEIPEEILNQIITHAGSYVGVGDWRPAKKGKYGKFMLTSFKEVR